MLIKTANNNLDSVGDTPVIFQKEKKLFLDSGAVAQLTLCPTFEGLAVIIKLLLHVLFHVSSFTN